MSWFNFNMNAFADRKSSVQPMYRHNLIRVFPIHLHNLWILKNISIENKPLLRLQKHRMMWICTSYFISRYTPYPTLPDESTWSATLLFTCRKILICNVRKRPSCYMQQETPRAACAFTHSNQDLFCLSPYFTAVSGSVSTKILDQTVLTGRTQLLKASLA